MKQKNAVSKKTERILLRMLDYIEQEPKRLEMGSWGAIYSKATKTKPIITSNTYHKVKLPPCKTTACIAGTCLLVTKIGQKFLRDNSISQKFLVNYEDGIGDSVDFPDTTPDKARDILGISKKMADSLFYFGGWSFSGYSWPMEFEEQYRNAKTARGRFNATKRRVLHFIKTGE